MAIKDWKNRKPKTYPKELTEYGNLILFQYWNTKTRIEISCIFIKGLGYRTTIRKIPIGFQFSNILSEQTFKTKQQAFEYAKAYMRKH